MNVLIMTIPGDTHGHAALWALDKLGHRCNRWWSCELGAKTAELHLTNKSVFTRLTGPEGEIRSDTIDSIWFRRFRLPALDNTLTEGDQMVALRELDAFLRGIKFAFRTDAFWANAPQAQLAGAAKAAQLVAARRVGLSIPRTLMTNDMKAVRVFAAGTNGPVVCKGFRPAAWRSDSGAALLQTAILDDEHLADPDSLRLCPAIFQDFIRKAYELRIAIFGRTCIAAKITNQDAIDWRTTYEMKLEPYQLPEQIETRLLFLMDQLGLVMGSIDMIVTPEGEHVFVEINEQGQFLWVEKLNPDIALLEPFARFLASGDPLFHWNCSDKVRIRYADYTTSSAAKEFVETEAHLRSGGSITVVD